MFLCFYLALTWAITAAYTLERSQTFLLPRCIAWLAQLITSSPIRTSLSFPYFAINPDKQDSTNKKTAPTFKARSHLNLTDRQHFTDRLFSRR
jgi:hypothetical protein